MDFGAILVFLSIGQRFRFVLRLESTCLIIINNTNQFNINAKFQFRFCQICQHCNLNLNNYVVGRYVGVWVGAQELGLLPESSGDWYVRAESPWEVDTDSAVTG